MPFGAHTHFFFKPEELKKFSPDYVVQWMDTHQGARSSRDQNGEVQTAGLSVLPDAADLPVIVAVRMILSFPFLSFFAQFRFMARTLNSGQRRPMVPSTFPNLVSSLMEVWPTIFPSISSTAPSRAGLRNSFELRFARRRPSLEHGLSFPGHSRNGGLATPQAARLGRSAGSGQRRSFRRVSSQRRPHDRRVPGFQSHDPGALPRSAVRQIDSG